MSNQQNYSKMQPSQLLIELRNAYLAQEKKEQEAHVDAIIRARIQSRKADPFYGTKFEAK